MGRGAKAEENASHARLRKWLSWSESARGFIWSAAWIAIVSSFGVSARMIPSPSMEPTLMGHDGRKDRLLVNRLRYVFGSVERWDIIVFRHPHDQSTDMIKRVGGLGGERIAIADGDVYIDGQIARKSDRIQGAVWLPVTALVGADRLADWSHDAVRVKVDGDEVTLASGDAPTWLRYGRRKAIVDTYLRPGVAQPIVPPMGGGTRPVGDVRLRANVRVASGGSLALELLALPDRFLLADGTLRHERAGQLVHEQPLALAPAAGAWHALELRRADRRLVLRLGGRELLRYDHERPLAEARTSTEAVEVAVGGQGLTLDDVRIDRDLHYTNEGVLGLGPDRRPMQLTVPKGRYFMLGDNSGNSSDSRLWRVQRVHLQGGRVLHVPLDQRKPAWEQLSRGRMLIRDTYGNWHGPYENDAIVRSEVIGWNGARVEPEWQTIAHETIVGRASVRLWPPLAIGFLR